MRILFGGGATGGHFYPIVAIAEELNQIIEKEKILEAKLYFLSPTPYNEKALFDNGIIYKSVAAGKLRRYFSIANFFDFWKTLIGSIQALITVFFIYPDVVFGKGGYASFPALFAARLLGIPVFIHESDSHPGRVNAWAAKFAKRIAVSWEEAIVYFPKEKTAYTGQPIRKSIRLPQKEGAYDYLQLEPSVPTIFVMGGSQGAELINDVLLRALPDLLKKYQVIHQAGPKNVELCQKLTSVILKDDPNKGRYKVYGYLNDLSLRMAAGISTMVISRAGSTIFEIAAWGLPSILVPISEEVSHDQMKNAFNYARYGAAVVIEENNLTPHVLTSEIDKIASNKDLQARLSAGAKRFYRPDAAQVIAKEIMALAIEHEK